MPAQSHDEKDASETHDALPELLLFLCLFCDDELGILLQDDPKAPHGAPFGFKHKCT